MKAMKRGTKRREEEKVQKKSEGMRDEGMRDGREGKREWW